MTTSAIPNVKSIDRGKSRTRRIRADRLEKSALIRSFSVIRGLLAQNQCHAVQIIPAQLQSAMEQYYLVNVRTVGNIDLDRSQVTMFDAFPDEVEKVRKLVLKDFATHPVPTIFRLEEIPSCILVAESLRDRISSLSESAGIFIEIDDYRLGYI